MVMTITMTEEGEIIIMKMMVMICDDDNKNDDDMTDGVVDER